MNHPSHLWWGVGIRRVDRALGAIVVTIVAALVASTLAASISALGVPGISQAIASSQVLRAINTITPVPVQGFIHRRFADWASCKLAPTLIQPWPSGKAPV